MAKIFTYVTKPLTCLLFALMFPLQFLYSVSSTAFRVKWGLKKSEKETADYLHAFELKLNGKFDDKVFIKVVKMSSLQRHFINNTFTALYGRYTTEMEQERSILYFIMASLYDDFFDDKTHSVAQLNEMVCYPETIKPSNFNEHAFIYAHLYLLGQVPDKAAYSYAYKGLHEAEVDSLKQFDPQISDAALLSITTRKGGFSLLMCRHYIDMPTSKTMDDCWFAIGSLIQLTNDLFDIYKDIKDGINTFATRTTRYQDAEIIFNKQVAALKAAITALPFPSRKKIRFSITLSAVSAFGLIAIDNLKRLQGNANQLPDFKLLPRKELIIDMQKGSSILKMIGFAYRTAKL